MNIKQIHMKIVFKNLVLLLLILPVLGISQINKPGLSPKIIKEEKVGLVQVKLEYGQPSVRGREIFGALIPYDKVWRTGANSSTKIHFDSDVYLNEQKVPQGSYALYSIPEKLEWTIIISENTGLWGAGGYSEKDDLLRIKVPVVQLNDKVETLSIHFEEFNANGANLVIVWENSKVVIPVFIDSDSKIYKEIQVKIIDGSENPVKAQTYFDAAQFYYEKNKELKQASIWMDKAIELKPSAFWFVYYRAELAYILGDMKLAKEMASKSLKMAQESASGDYGYIAKCELLLQKMR
jgi:tetratricopeptide (TPR) repeat protein